MASSEKKVSFAVCQFPDENDPNKYHILCTNEIYHKDAKGNRYVTCNDKGIQYGTSKTLRRRVEMPTDLEGQSVGAYIVTKIVTVFDEKDDAVKYIDNVGTNVGRGARARKPKTLNLDTPEMRTSFKMTNMKQRCIPKKTKEGMEMKKLKDARLKAKQQEEEEIDNWMASQESGESNVPMKLDMRKIAQKRQEEDYRLWLASQRSSEKRDRTAETSTNVTMKGDVYGFKDSGTSTVVTNDKSEKQSDKSRFDRTKLDNSEISNEGSVLDTQKQEQEHQLPDKCENCPRDINETSATIIPPNDAVQCEVEVADALTAVLENDSRSQKYGESGIGDPSLTSEKMAAIANEDPVAEYATISSEGSVLDTQQEQKPDKCENSCTVIEKPSAMVFLPSEENSSCDINETSTTNIPPNVMVQCEHEVVDALRAVLETDDASQTYDESGVDDPAITSKKTAMIANEDPVGECVEIEMQLKTLMGIKDEAEEEGNVNPETAEHSIEVAPTSPSEKSSNSLISDRPQNGDDSFHDEKSTESSFYTSSPQDNDNYRLPERGVVTSSMSTISCDEGVFDDILTYQRVKKNLFPLPYFTDNSATELNATDRKENSISHSCDPLMNDNTAPKETEKKTKPKIICDVLCEPHNRVPLSALINSNNVPSSKPKKEENVQESLPPPPAPSQRPQSELQVKLWKLNLPSSFASLAIQNRSKTIDEYCDNTPRRSDVILTPKNLTAVAREKMESADLRSDCSDLKSVSWANEVERSIDESVEFDVALTMDKTSDDDSRETNLSTLITNEKIVPKDNEDQSAGTSTTMTTRRRKKERKSKKELLPCDKYEETLKKMEQRLARQQREFLKHVMANLDDVKSKQEETVRLLKPQKNCDNENDSQHYDDNQTVSGSSGTRTVKELLDSCEEKIKLLDVVLDREALATAATSSTAKKRVNALMKAMWTEEERLKLKVRKIANEKVTLISKQQLSKIRELALYLNKHRKLETKLLRQSKVNEYVSDKLKADKYRKSETFRKKQQLQGKKQQRNVHDDDDHDEKQDTPSERTETEDDSMETYEEQEQQEHEDEHVDDDSVPSTISTPSKTLTRYKGKHRRNITDELHEPRKKLKESIRVDMTAAIAREKQQPKESECIEKFRCSYERLIQLLGKPLTEKYFNEGSRDGKLYSWLQLRRETKFSDTDLSRIMTNDSFIIIGGKCRLVDITFEKDLVLQMCKAMDAVCDENYTVSYNDLKRALTHGPLTDDDFLTYIVNKYTSEERYEETSQLRRVLSFAKVFALRFQLNVMTNFACKCDELITTTLELPYCHISRDFAEQMLQLERKKTEDSDYVMTIEEFPAILMLEGKEIIRRNYNKQVHNGK